MNGKYVLFPYIAEPRCVTSVFDSSHREEGFSPIRPLWQSEERNKMPYHSREIHGAFNLRNGNTLPCVFRKAAWRKDPVASEAT